MATPFKKRGDQFPDPIILTPVANGVMDESGRFHPYITATVTVIGKANVRYFVRSCFASFSDSGIKIARSGSAYTTVGGIVSQLIYLDQPAMTLATDFISGSGSMDCCVMSDRGAPIVIAASGNVVVRVVYAVIIVGSEVTGPR